MQFASARLGELSRDQRDKHECRHST
jgi:hypothetical protein